jgi:hypothetical protein
VAVGGVAEIHGQAGSAAIFNVSLLHTVSENEFSVHFLYRNDHFTKTGSGQNIGKALKKNTFSQVTIRPTTRERKSIQVYYGKRERAPLGDESVVPVSLWRDHADAEVRGFYGNLNKRTKRLAVEEGRGGTTHEILTRLGRD